LTTTVAWGRNPAQTLISVYAMGMAAVFTAIGEHRRAPYLGHATLGLAPGLPYGAELPEAAETTGGRSPVSGLGPLVTV
jgi:hypothetical protein